MQSLKSTVSRQSMSKSLYVGEQLQHNKWSLIAVLARVLRVFPVRCEIPKCSEMRTLKWPERINKGILSLKEKKQDTFGPKVSAS